MKNVEFDEGMIDVMEEEMYMDDEDMVDNDDLDAFTAAFNRGYKTA